jgi:uncharacterized protein DUF6788
MPITQPPAGAKITYRQQYRRCGKTGCSVCGPGGQGHGPYWYAYWSEGGRMRSRYVGKDAPVEAPRVAEPVGAQAVSPSGAAKSRSPPPTGAGGRSPPCSSCCWARPATACIARR